LYGVTAYGGTIPCGASEIGCGVAFSLTPPSQDGGAWTESILHSFQAGADGALPTAGLLAGLGGALMGTTSYGGVASNCPSGCGAFFELTPPAQPAGGWSYQVLYNYSKEYRSPEALLAGSGGSFYGTAEFGGSRACSDGCGSIYELAPQSSGYSLTRLHEFDPISGETPSWPLIWGPNGVLYGIAEGGDSQGRSCGGCGVVYSLSPPVAPSTTWTYQDIYRFRGGADGFNPVGGLAMASNGVLYGVTYYGGQNSTCTSGCGTVFSLTPPASGTGLWTKVTLHIFLGGSDGYNPDSGVVIGTGGVLYGTTPGGGTGCSGPGCGVLYALTPPTVPGGSWTESIVYAFTGGADGAYPYFTPALDSNGTLYGFAEGGSGGCFSGAGCGVVWQYIP
jgi:hypothetical protein